MVIAFIFAQCFVFHPLFHTAVPSGRFTMSPSFAALIASQTASGVNAVAVRVSARTALGTKAPAATRNDNTNNHRNGVRLMLIVKGICLLPCRRRLSLRG